MTPLRRALPPCANCSPAGFFVTMSSRNCANFLDSLQATKSLNLLSESAAFRISLISPTLRNPIWINWVDFEDYFCAMNFISSKAMHSSNHHAYESCRLSCFFSKWDYYWTRTTVRRSTISHHKCSWSVILWLRGRVFALCSYITLTT